MVIALYYKYYATNKASRQTNIVYFILELVDVDLRVENVGNHCMMYKYFE